MVQYTCYSDNMLLPSRSTILFGRNRVHKMFFFCNKLLHQTLLKNKTLLYRNKIAQFFVYERKLSNTIESFVLDKSGIRLWHDKKVLQKTWMPEKAFHVQRNHELKFPIIELSINFILQCITIQHITTNYYRSLIISFHHNILFTYEFIHTKKVGGKSFLVNLIESHFVEVQVTKYMYIHLRNQFPNDKINICTLVPSTKAGIIYPFFYFIMFDV
jgi:hypothetical protein